MDSNGKFCNIGDTRSRTDFQFPRCRTIKLQSANTISTAALRENEYSKVASLKSKCQSALRRRRTEEGELVVGGGEKEGRREEGERKQNEKDFWSGCVIDVTSRWPRNTGIWPFSKSASKCAIDVDKWTLILRTFHLVQGLIANRIEKRRRRKCENNIRFFSFLIWKNWMYFANEISNIF